MAKELPNKWKKRYKALWVKLQLIANYPDAGHPRGTDDGYPAEFEYDEFAYKRMVDSYRKAIRKAIGKK